jgi:predicted aminopeptidase
MTLPDLSTRRRTGRRWAWALILLTLAILASCSNLGYYSQSLWGGARVLAKRQSVTRLIADPKTSPEMREKLSRALEMREFAVAELALPENDSYRKYSDLDRPYVMWNVVAAPELSVAPETWCFLIAGCVAYRGYFSEQRARRFGDKLSERGYDVDVGGVAAYSTVGWFADPLLSTFINRAEPHLAGLLFHELAHQQVFIKGDTMFNESFAMAVEEQGALRWLEHRGLEEQMASYRLVKLWEKEFSELVLSYRERLEVAYASDQSDAWKRRQKREILDSLEASYAELKASWDGYSGFDGWFGRDLNNARLALIGVYHQFVPSFLALLARHGGDFASFYAEVERISKMPLEERHAQLESLLDQADAAPGAE